MPKIIPFHIRPSLPDRVACLEELAMNLRWSWDHETIDLFRRLDSNLWESAGHNPRRMLGEIDQRRLKELARDEAFLAFMDRVHRDFKEYLNTPGWFPRAHPEARDLRVAYFSAEFGLTECFPVYAGGLGILAGDHLKSASDLGLPLVGVGLLYQVGYFNQYLNADGWQQESYPLNDFHNLPIEELRDPPGHRLQIAVEFPGRMVHAQIWKAQVGRVPLYLLDANILDNSPADREITGALYGGDRERRIQQEILLGIGGMRALERVGVEPTVCHMNEGHSAFLGFERARLFQLRHGVSYSVARQSTAAGNIFTTHTPVPAGFDVFAPELMEKYFREYSGRLGISFERFLTYGRFDPERKEAGFNMAALASRHSSYMTAVSRLHERVTRGLARQSWPGYPNQELPVTHVTNGVHIPSWISQEMGELLTRYLGPRWLDNPTDYTIWERIDQIPNEELWRTARRRQERLVSWARRRLAQQLKNRGASGAAIEEASTVLDSRHLTIGFARRFATYKRATLMLRDPERLKRILSNPNGPVQILIAGKAHPHDTEGKELIRRMIHFARDPEVRQRLVFLEDYDMSVARYMVQGCDVWLNTPRRPNEASGTSGMKLLANGGLNLSILDGWWDEAFEADVGWAIGRGEEYPDADYQDRVESEALYDLLEQDVVPLFYERDSTGIPRGWVNRMKASMKWLSPVFNTNRMVAEYAERFYVPVSERYARLSADGAKRAQGLVAWRKRVIENWKDVRVHEVTHANAESLRVGDRLSVSAVVNLGPLQPEDVTVQIFTGTLNPDRQIADGATQDMSLAGPVPGGHRYLGEVECNRSGLCGLTVRVVPRHDDALVPYEIGQVTWAED